MIHFASSVSRFPDSGKQVREPGQREPVSRDRFPDSGKRVRGDGFPDSGKRVPRIGGSGVLETGSRTAGIGCPFQGAYLADTWVPGNGFPETGSRKRVPGSGFQGTGSRIWVPRDGYLADTVPRSGFPIKSWVSH
jgi:hypothetical protein